MSYSCLYPKHRAQWLAPLFSLLSHSPLRRPHSRWDRKKMEFLQQAAPSTHLWTFIQTVLHTLSPKPYHSLTKSFLSFSSLFINFFLQDLPNSPSLDEGDVWVFQVYPNMALISWQFISWWKKNTSSHPQHLAWYLPHHMNLKST